MENAVSIKEIKNAKKILMGNTKGRGNLEDVGVDETSILKYILRK
jgi:hypothetical protein